MSVDYKGIADAVLDGEDAETAFARLSAETIEQPPPAEIYESELGLMSRLGVQLADTILTKIDGAVSERVVRMIRSERGINLADPQTAALVAGLVQAGVLDQATEADQLMEPTLPTQVAKWPGLKLGHVVNAIEWRAGGMI